jgi:hypothetical protein
MSGGGLNLIVGERGFLRKKGLGQGAGGEGVGEEMGAKWNF